MAYRSKRMAQLMQCKEGTLDRRNINNIVRKVARLQGEKRRSDEDDGEEDISGRGGSGAKKRRVRVNMVRGEGQYVYNEEGDKFLDCAASVTHVGHSNPDVLRAFNESQHSALLWNGANVDKRNLSQRAAFLSRFRALLPPDLQEVVLLNSGSAANGLAIQICQMATGGTDVVVFDHTFHGSLSVTSSCSPITFQTYPGTSQPAHKPWVHVLPVPDLYRGPYREQDPAAVMKYFCEAKQMLERKVAKGAKIACLIMEPIFTFQGMSLAEPIYIQELFKFIHSLGALVIVDEVQGGLGRTGPTWAYQNLGVEPDVLTCGKPLANGYPFAVMVTSGPLLKHIQGLTGVIEQEGLNTGLSLAVLGVIESQGLLDNVKRVGRRLRELLTQLRERRQNVGMINGRGFMLGIDLVKDKETREPAPKLAAWLIVKMRERKVLMAKVGEFSNVVAMMPPLCFTVDNAEELVVILDEVLKEAEELSYDNLDDVSEDESFWNNRLSEEDICYEDMD